MKFFPIFCWSEKSKVWKPLLQSVQPFNLDNLSDGKICPKSRRNLGTQYNPYFMDHIASNTTVSFLKICRAVWYNSLWQKWRLRTITNSLINYYNNQWILKLYFGSNKLNPMKWLKFTSLTPVYACYELSTFSIFSSNLKCNLLMANYSIEMLLVAAAAI